MCPRPVRCVAVTVEPQVGGGVRFDVDASGTSVLITGRFLAIDRPNLLRFTVEQYELAGPNSGQRRQRCFHPDRWRPRHLMSIEHSLLAPNGIRELPPRDGWPRPINRGGAVMTSTGVRKAVANTGLLVAAIRAKESAREDRLFTDPFADKLAGETGKELLAAAITGSGEQSTAQIVVRTRFFDDALLRLAQLAKQVVILAAGMDARAYRLDWPDGTTVYEVDQQDLHRRQSPTARG